MMYSNRVLRVIFPRKKKKRKKKVTAVSVSLFFLLACVAFYIRPGCPRIRWKSVQRGSEEQNAYESAICIWTSCKGRQEQCWPLFVFISVVICCYPHTCSHNASLFFYFLSSHCVNSQYQTLVCFSHSFCSTVLSCALCFSFSHSPLAPGLATPPLPLTLPTSLSTFSTHHRPFLSVCSLVLSPLLSPLKTHKLYTICSSIVELQVNL